MPEGVKAEDANASFSKGVLEITLPVAKRGAQTASPEIRGESHRKPGAKRRREGKPRAFGEPPYQHARGRSEEGVRKCNAAKS
jgi:hypothetical protein